jgi:hypothetical protein
MILRRLAHLFKLVEANNPVRKDGAAIADSRLMIAD